MSDEKKQTKLTEKQKISKSRAEKTRRINKSRVGKDISLRQPASRIKWVANRVVLQTKEIRDALKSDDGEVAKLRFEKGENDSGIVGSTNYYICEYQRNLLQRVAEKMIIFAKTSKRDNGRRKSTRARVTGEMIIATACSDMPKMLAKDAKEIYSDACKEIQTIAATKADKEEDHDDDESGRPKMRSLSLATAPVNRLFSAVLGSFTKDAYAPLAILAATEAWLRRLFKMSLKFMLGLWDVGIFDQDTVLRGKGKQTLQTRHIYTTMNYDRHPFSEIAGVATIFASQTHGLRYIPTEYLSAKSMKRNRPSLSWNDDIIASVSKKRAIDTEKEGHSVSSRAIESH